MSSYCEFLLNPQSLNSSSHIQANIVFKRNNMSTILGRILCCNSNPIVNAVVVVDKLDYNFNPPKITTIGNLVTNQHGEFAIYIERIDGVYYKFQVFEPLQTPGDKPC